MANVVSTKKVKIKPEDQVEAEGTVVRCRYAGETRIGFGPMAKSVHIYKVFIEVDGLDKPLVLKVKEDQGYNLGVVNDIKSMGKMFGGKKTHPVQEGDKLTVIYNKNKPKKCNVKEEPKAA